MTPTRPHLVDGVIVHLPLSAEELKQKQVDEAAHNERETMRKEPPPVEKLAAFLNANPDVKALIEDNE